jgi:hypothetical protein
VCLDVCVCDEVVRRNSRGVIDAFFLPLREVYISNLEVTPFFGADLTDRKGPMLKEDEAIDAQADVEFISHVISLHWYKKVESCHYTGKYSDKILVMSATEQFSASR